jgi:hypothetical protein
MKRTLIRYKTKPKTTEENQRLIENVFRELQTKSVDGFRYVVLKLGDGSFLHFFEAEDGASPMVGIKAFQLFQAGGQGPLPRAAASERSGRHWQLPDAKRAMRRPPLGTRGVQEAITGKLDQFPVNVTAAPKLVKFPLFSVSPSSKGYCIL